MPANEQAFGWSSNGGLQDDTSADSNVPSPYPGSRIFNQTDGIYEPHYYPGQEGHHVHNPENVLWQQPPNYHNTQVSQFVPDYNGITRPQRSPFHTAPPHPLGPSQTYEPPGYHSNSQPQDAQPREMATLYEMPMPFNRTNVVDMNQLLQTSGEGSHTQMDVDHGDLSNPRLSLPTTTQELAGVSCDDDAVSMIRISVKKNPTKFFFPENIEALVKLTSLSSDTIRRVMSQVLEEDLRDPNRITGSSEYSKSSAVTFESLRTSNQSISSVTTVHSQSARATGLQQIGAIFGDTINVPSVDARQILRQASEFLLDSTARNCRPTSDLSLLSRDGEKIHQCTFKCGKSFARKADLRRHEEEKNYPQEGWTCDVDPIVTIDGVSTCAYCRLLNPSTSHAQDDHRNRTPFCHEREIGASGKIFTRKKHFIDHCRTFHPALPVAECVQKCHFAVQSELPKWCGFCEQSHSFDDSKARNDHMARHFEEDLDMTQWKDPLAPTRTTDEDDDDDLGGDGDDTDPDADHDMDEAEAEYPTGHDHQPNGGSSNGSSGQNSENINGSFSSMALEGCGHNKLAQATIKLRQNNGITYMDSFATNKSLAAKKEQGSPLLHSLPNENHWGLSRNSQRKLSNSPQQDASHDEKIWIFRTRTSGTGEFTLEEDLWNARVTYKSHRSFIPITELRRLITMDRVSQELRGHYPEVSEDDMANGVQIIIRNATRLFALLVLIGKGDQIINLMNEGIKDDDLPISSLRCKEIRVFSEWKTKTVEHFKQDQWSVISPIFKAVGQHYELDDHIILPFIENKERPEQLIAGGYSDVRSVRIHPAHLDMSWSTRVSHSPLFIAVKRLHSTDPTNFEKEARMLRELAKKNHPHIIKLLATYRLGGHYHLMFPWADKNLRAYWHDDPKPKWNQETLLWDIRQMLGIASALQTIHNFKNQPQRLQHPSHLLVPGTEITMAEEEYLYGRHGDIKPENILWSNELDGLDDLGILQIADFGLGRFHGRGSRSQVDPRTIASTPTYEPPEIALNLKVSRAYDIWSLGCLFLEYITWRLGGYKLLEAFGNARLTENKDGVVYDKFYTLQENDLGLPLSQLPTRVINVGDIGTDPYLQETRGEHGHYAALSYCWGTQSRFITTAKSIEDRKRRISFSTLPKMFRDAINVCRRSGVRYLWIDSLCIVQDSREDLDAEGSKIGTVYQGAQFTLIAATPENYEDGLSIKTKRDPASGHIKYSSSDIGKTCVVHKVVLQWIDRLRGFNRCSRAVHDLLDLIQDHLLVVDAHRRTTSTILLLKLQDLAARATADEQYLLSPAPQEITLDVIEKAVCGKAYWADKFYHGDELWNLSNTRAIPVDWYEEMAMAGIGGKFESHDACRYFLRYTDSTTCFSLLTQPLTAQRVSESFYDIVLKPRILNDPNRLRHVEEHRMIFYNCLPNDGSDVHWIPIFDTPSCRNLACCNCLRSPYTYLRPIKFREGQLLLLHGTPRFMRKFRVEPTSDASFCCSSEDMDTFHNRPWPNADTEISSIYTSQMHTDETIQCAFRADFDTAESKYLHSPSMNRERMFLWEKDSFSKFPFVSDIATLDGSDWCGMGKVWGIRFVRELSNELDMQWYALSFIEIFEIQESCLSQTPSSEERYPDYLPPLKEINDLKDNMARNRRVENLLIPTIEIPGVQLEESDQQTDFTIFVCSNEPIREKKDHPSRFLAVAPATGLGEVQHRRRASFDEIDYQIDYSLSRGAKTMPPTETIPRTSIERLSGGWLRQDTHILAPATRP